MESVEPMERNMELIRKILLKVESNTHQLKGPTLIEGFSQALLVYNIKLLAQAGFITPSSLIDATRGYSVNHISGLTWEGHDFLDSIRDDSTWTHVKSKIKDIGSVPLEVVKALAIAYLTNKLTSASP